MKKIFPFLLILAFLAGCKSKDATPSVTIANTSWTGTFKYNTRTVDDWFSIQFNKDNSFKWSEVDGDFSGKWSISGTTLTFTFDSGTIVKGEIKDNVFFVTSNTATTWQLKTLELSNTSVNLDNTKWLYTTITVLFAPGNAVSLNTLKGTYTLIAPDMVKFTLSNTTETVVGIGKVKGTSMTFTFRDKFGSGAATYYLYTFQKQ